MNEMVMREAQAGDVSFVCDFLRRLDLVTEGVLAAGTRYWLMENLIEGVIGCAGVEFGANAGLLRSVAVAPEFRRQGIAEALVNCVFDACVNAGCVRVFCFSTGAGGYWQRLGFWEVPVVEVVAALPLVPQVLHFERLGWLPTEIAWGIDLLQ